MLDKLDDLYEIQSILIKEMPEEGTPIRDALDRTDKLIDEIVSERGYL